MPMTRFISVQTGVEGLHHWPAAASPDAYLARPHRHLFVVTAQIAVAHHDREIEINDATRWLDTTLRGFGRPDPDGGPLDFGPQSCERLAERAVNAITDRYGPHRQVRCTVLEDGILGAGVDWQPDTTEPR